MGVCAAVAGSTMNPIAGVGCIATDQILSAANQSDFDDCIEKLEN